jgi:hypothetical protein
MPLSPDEFFDNARTTANEDGRAGLSGITRWDIFPFEQDGLRVVPLDAPALPEPARNGEDPAACRNCRAGDDFVVWQDDTWRLEVLPKPSGAPLVLVLMPKEHFDVSDLPAELAAQLELIVIQTARAIESLEHVARTRLSVGGRGGAFAHSLFRSTRGFRAAARHVSRDLGRPLVSRAARDARRRRDQSGRDSGRVVGGIAQGAVSCHDLV